MRTLADRYRTDLAARDELSSYELRVFSQNGEDGVLAEILHRLGPGSKTFVEFGAGTGAQGNCVLLADCFSWSGLFIEADPEYFVTLSAKYAGNHDVETVRAEVSPDNVNKLFQAAKVPSELDVLSIDIDGQDYWVWAAISEYRPRVVVVEYNATLDVESVLVQPREVAGPWDGTTYFGASLGAFCTLADEKGYALVHTDLTGVNAFFVRTDLAAAVGVDRAPRRAANYGLQGAQLPPDPQGRAWLDPRSGTRVGPVTPPGAGSDGPYAPDHRP
jgi:hypothetical protein